MDKNHDGYVSYSEFCWLSEEKRRGLDFPTNDESSFKASTIAYIDDDVERMSNASHMYKGFKSNKLKNRLLK